MWANPYAERLIGSIRRECLNHFVILNARHLKRTLFALFVGGGGFWLAISGITTSRGLTWDWTSNVRILVRSRAR